ncbi:hypothetical protein LCGC14_2518580 [marine sediment metagenome]|uniref:Uncharacterized protein n=1 Tax=marine sediment metagenome TaxID=412755 RepID=A0A0F9AXH9_9ZZZZ
MTDRTADQYVSDRIRLRLTTALSRGDYWLYQALPTADHQAVLDAGVRFLKRLRAAPGWSATVYCITCKDVPVDVASGHDTCERCLQNR